MIIVLQFSKIVLVRKYAYELTGLTMAMTFSDMIKTINWLIIDYSFRKIDHFFRFAFCLVMAVF